VIEVTGILYHQSMQTERATSPRQTTTFQGRAFQSHDPRLEPIAAKVLAAAGKKSEMAAV